MMSRKLSEVSVEKLISQTKRLKKKYDEEISKGKNPRKLRVRLKNALSKLKVMRDNRKESGDRNSIIKKLEKFYAKRKHNYLGVPNWDKFTSAELLNHLGRIEAKGFVD